jgi:hypothetical protein
VSETQNIRSFSSSFVHQSHCKHSFDEITKKLKYQITAVNFLQMDVLTQLNKVIKALSLVPKAKDFQQMQKYFKCGYIFLRFAIFEQFFARIIFQNLQTNIKEQLKTFLTVSYPSFT